MTVGRNSVAVLVTDGLMKKSLSVVRSIAPVADDIGVTAPYRVSMAGLSRETDRQHVVDRTDPEAFVRSLDRIVTGGSYDYVLPVGGWTTAVLSRHRDRVDAPLEAVLPDREAMATAQDKWRTYQRAVDLGVPVPSTVAPESAEDLQAAEEFDFPVIVKAPDESAPRFVERVDSTAALRRVARRYHSDTGSWPLIQEEVTGEGCGLFALYLDGECQGHYAHRRIREYPPSGGASACAESIHDERLTDLGLGLLDDLAWHGPAMVEFKRDADGEPHLIEINPKFWGSLDLGRYSGLEFPRALLTFAASGRKPSFSFAGTRCHWPLSGDLQHAVRRPESAPQVAVDCLSTRTRSNLSVTDPLPHLFEAGKAIVSPFL